MVARYKILFEKKTRKSLATVQLRQNPIFELIPYVRFFPAIEAKVLSVGWLFWKIETVFDYSSYL